MARTEADRRRSRELHERHRNALAEGSERLHERVPAAVTRILDDTVKTYNDKRRKAKW